MPIGPKQCGFFFSGFTPTPSATPSGTKAFEGNVISGATVEESFVSEGGRIDDIPSPEAGGLPTTCKWIGKQPVVQEG